MNGRGHEWSFKILQCPHNKASAQNAPYILVGACLLVHACSLFSGGSCLKVLVAREANFCQCLFSERKTLCSHARKDQSMLPIFLYKLKKHQM